MLTAAIATKEQPPNETWRACLQQTGLVHSVQDWTISPEQLPRNGATSPDVVLLDISRSTDESFSFAAQLHQLCPSVRIVACTHVQDPTRELLMQAMRSGVQDIVSKPLDPQKLQDILARFVKDSQRSAVRNQNLLVVMGSKGGVGTTTVAVNLAVQLIHVSRKKVVVLDFTRPIGHSALLLDLQPRFSLRDAIENLDRLDGHFFSGLLTRHKSGLEVLAGMTHPEEWQRVSLKGLARLVNVAQSTFDFVVVDYGTSYSAEGASILPLSRMVLFVAESSVPSLWALQKQLAAVSALGLRPEQIRIVINRWHRDDDEVLKSVERDFKHPIFARLPNDFRQVSEAINQGIPLARNHNNSLVATFQRLAGQLAGVPMHTSAKRKGFTGLFSSR